MSLIKCDITGSTERVEDVHPQCQTDKVKRACFRLGMKIEAIRISCINELSEYKGSDLQEKLDLMIKSRLASVYGDKSQSKPAEKQLDQVKATNAPKKTEKKLKKVTK